MCQQVARKGLPVFVGLLVDDRQDFESIHRLAASGFELGYQGLDIDRTRHEQVRRDIDSPFRERREQIVELIQFLRIQLRTIGLPFREFPFVMVNPDCIVSETCETFGQSVGLLMANVVSGEAEVHSVESL